MKIFQKIENFSKNRKFSKKIQKIENFLKPRKT